MDGFVRSFDLASASRGGADAPLRMTPHRLWLAPVFEFEEQRDKNKTKTKGVGQECPTHTDRDQGAKPAPGRNSVHCVNE